MAYNMNKKNNMYQNPYYSSINPNTGFSTGNTPNDIWYNLGALAGAIWGNNYNERGEGGGFNSAMNILNGVNGDMASTPTDVSVDDVSVSMPKSPDDLYNNMDAANAVGSYGYQQQAGPITAAVGAQQQQQPTNAISAGDQQQQMTAGPITMATGAGQTQQSPSTVSIGGTRIADGNFPQPRTALTNGYASSGSNINETASGQTASESTISAGQPTGVTATIPRDLGAEKLDYIAGKYNLSDNPDGDRTVIGSTTNNLKNIISLAKLGVDASTDPEVYKAAITMQLKKDGRTPYQIQQVMSAVEPFINAKVKEHKKTMYQGLLGSYLEAVESRDYTKAQIIGSQMAEYDPDATKIAMAGLPTLRDEYNLQGNFDKMDKEHKYKVSDMYTAGEIAKDNAKYTKDLGFADFVSKEQYKIRSLVAAGIPPLQAALFLYGGAKTKNGTATSGTGDNGDNFKSQLEWVQLVEKSYSDYAKNNPDKPNPYETQHKLAQNIMTKALTGGQGLSTVPQNPNDYYGVHYWLAQLRQAAGGRFSLKQLAEIARQQFKKEYGEGGTGYLEQALKESGWV